MKGHSMTCKIKSRTSKMGGIGKRAADYSQIQKTQRIGGEVYSYPKTKEKVTSKFCFLIN